MPKSASLELQLCTPHHCGSLDRHGPDGPLYLDVIIVSALHLRGPQGSTHLAGPVQGTGNEKKF